MRKNTVIIGVLTCALFAGCASLSNTVVTQSVGPGPERPKIDLGKGLGQLLVYTALEVDDPVNAYFPTHGSYTIFSPDGKWVKHVDNRNGSFYQNPAKVSLPVGKYKIEGRATNAGSVVVPVVVEEGKVTIVDLEGATLPQHKPTGAGQWVRLPNGQVVGMRTN